MKRNVIAIVVVTLGLVWGEETIGQTLTNAWWDGTSNAPVLHLQFDALQTNPTMIRNFAPDYEFWSASSLGSNTEFQIHTNDWSSTSGNFPVVFPLSDSVLWYLLAYPPGSDAYGFSVVGGTPGQIGSFSGPPPELIAHFTFDEGTSTNAYDSTTNHLAGILFGSPLPSWTTGVFSNALSFDGVQNQVEVADDWRLTPRGALTVAAWVSLTSTNEGFTVSKWGTNGLTGSYLLYITPTNSEFHAFLNGNQITVVGTNTLSLTNWHHVAGVYTGTNLVLYVDGVLNKSIAATGRVDVVNFSLLMGGVAGKMDDVRLYNYALASTNILAIYQTDTNAGGLPDVWEINHFGSLTQGPSGDFDGDGFTNLQEYQNGTDPADYYNGVLPNLGVVSGNSQSGLTNTFLPQPFVVRIAGASNGALTNAPVTFHVSQGGGQLAATTNGTPSSSLQVHSGNDGTAGAFLLLSSSVGTNLVTVTATSGPNSTSVTFTAVATAPTGPTTNGLQLWLQADMGVTTNSSGLVSGWADQSGNGLDATQDVSGVQPQWVTNVFNGKPAVRFDGTSAFLKTAYTHLSGGLTYVVVFRTTSTNATAHYAGNAANNLIGDNTGAVYVGFGVNGGVAQYNHYVAGWEHLNGTQTVNNAAVHIATLTHNAGNGTANLYVDGHAESSSTLNYSSYTAFNRIGGGYVNGSGTGDLFDGDVAEVLVYTRVLSTAERQAVEQYLSGKYALTNLDSDGDGLPDAWELRYFGNLNHGPNEDPDGDGFTNLQEYQNGTDPNDHTNGGVTPTGLQLWLQADMGVTTNSSGLVTSWADQSGNGLNATQEVSGVQPQWVTNVFNGKPAVRFDGTSAFLKTAYTHLSGGLTYVVVFRTTSTNATAHYAGNAANNLIGDNTGAVYVGFGVNGGMAQYNHYVAGWEHLNGTQTVNNAAAHIATLTHNSGTGTANLYVDGVAQTNATIGYTTAYAAFNRIGGGYVNGSSTGDLFDGDVAEVLVYTRVLSTEERQAAEQYLSDKYALTNLDTDGNGLPDAWERQYFGHIGVDPNADADGDGVSNYVEYLQGRNPTKGAIADPGGAVKLQVFTPLE